MLSCVGVQVGAGVEGVEAAGELGDAGLAGVAGLTVADVLVPVGDAGVEAVAGVAPGGVVAADALVPVGEGGVGPGAGPAGVVGVAAVAFEGEAPLKVAPLQAASIPCGYQQRKQHLGVHHQHVPSASVSTEAAPLEQEPGGPGKARLFVFYRISMLLSISF